MRITGSETKWTGHAKGARPVVIERQPGQPWRITAGPPNLIGRSFRHLIDARKAVRDAPITIPTE